MPDSPNITPSPGVDANGVPAQGRTANTNVLGDGVKSPLNITSYAAGGTGVLNGAYGYVTTFVTALGETAPWSGTPPQVTATNQKITLSGIPVGPAGVIARRIYRSKANSGEAKDTYLLAEISDNTTTTYVDNTPDSGLGRPVSWVATNYGYLANADGVVASFGNSGSVTLGALAKAGYASVSIGGQAAVANVSGFRNVAVGIYALNYTDTGVQNVAVGTHAGAGIKGGTGNVFMGTYAGMTTQGGTGGSTTGSQNFNVGIGQEVMGQATGMGQQNTLLGFRTGYQLNSADQIVAVGAFAGFYANASRMIFMDNQARASLTDEQEKGFLYGKTEATPQTSVGNINAAVRIGAVVTVANLPAASAAYAFRRLNVSDSTVAYTAANIGTVVAGGGANNVPVFCNGTAWVIG